MIITIPAPSRYKTPNPPVIKPCKITLSEDTLSLNTSGGDLAVIVGLEDDSDLEEISAVSSSPEDVSVRREPISGVKARALYVVRSTSAKTGMYQVTFTLPCGKREMVVRVR